MSPPRELIPRTGSFSGRGGKQMNVARLSGPNVDFAMAGTALATKLTARGSLNTDDLPREAKEQKQGMIRRPMLSPLVDT
jgi:hypothetical protein